MLTSDLLVTKSYKGKIEPIYAKLDKENLEISGSLINPVPTTYRENIRGNYRGNRRN